MTETYDRKMLCGICSKLYERKLTVSAGGNMSVRTDDGHILITPSGRNKGALVPKDIVKVTMEGDVIGPGRPSVETMMHLALYRNSGGTGAVVHCHPTYCTVLAVRGEKIKAGLTPEGVLLLGDVPLIGYFAPGTEELAGAVAGHSSSKAMLMERHGAITHGKDLEEAYNRMEELEFQAKLQYLARDATELPEKEKKKIRGV